ncbi:MAG: DUF547 domain-containing protein [Pseudomonadota bacterium]
MTSRVVILLSLVLCCLQVGCAHQERFAPERWPADPTSDVRIDHSEWQRFLNRYLVPAYADLNRVDYASVKAGGQVELGSYLDSMTAVDIGRYNRGEQMAYWINVYNALTIDVIADAYPLDSILDLNGGRGPWDTPLFQSGSLRLSLNDIEHRILRGHWNEPRIHFAVNCASVGCPDVQPIAFTGDNLDAQLTLAAQSFAATPRAVAFQDDALQLSSLFDWYQNDFASSERELLAYLARFAGPQTAVRLRSWSDKVRYDYDWRLNDISALQ